jgi:hypothetical protein
VYDVRQTIGQRKLTVNHLSGSVIAARSSCAGDSDQETEKSVAESIGRLFMEKIINFFNQYYYETMDWYQALTFLEQMGVLFGLFIALFGVVAIFIIRK